MPNILYLNQFKTTTLSVVGGIDDSQTTGIVIQSVSGLDTTKPGIACLTYNDPLDLDNAEYIEYTAINSTTKEFTGVTRGAEGYSAKSHSNGVTVAFPVSESHVNRLADAVSIGGDPTNPITGVLDEDTMSSDSAVKVPTQQSVKAYVDANKPTALVDSNGVDAVLTEATASAVNEITIKNAATSGDPIIKATGDDTNIHLSVRGKGNGLVKFSVLRQNHTTNSYQNNSIVLTGWNHTTGNNTNSMSGTAVTFGITFSAYPIVLATTAGAKAATATDPTGTGPQGWMTLEVTAITTSGFTPYFTRNQKQGNTDPGTFGSSLSWITTWIAIGTL